MDRCRCMKCHTQRIDSFTNSKPVSNWWFTLADQSFFCFFFLLTGNSNRVATDYRLRQSHRQCVILHVVAFVCFFFLSCLYVFSLRLSDTLTASLGRGGHWRGWMLREWPFFSTPAPPKFHNGLWWRVYWGAWAFSCVSTTIYNMLCYCSSSRIIKGPPRSGALASCMFELSLAAMGK